MKTFIFRFSVRGRFSKKSPATCYYHIRQPYLNSSTACTIATSIVHSKLDYCNSIYYRFPKSQLSRLQQIQNFCSVLSLKLLSPAISLAYYALSTGSKSLNASNTSSSLLPTKFSQLPNLHTFITSSLFSVLRILSLHLLLLLLGHQHHPLWKQLIAPFFMLHFVSGTNSCCLFIYFILVPVPVSDSSVPSPITSSSLIHHSAYP